MQAAWYDAANLLRITEDYEGTRSEELFSPLQKMLDDMLEETSPRSATPEEMAAKTLGTSITTVGLLNAAWERFEHDTVAYTKEEAAAICDLEGGSMG